MKKIAFGLLVTGITVTSAVMGQNINTDPTYSIHNYKHPNKVKEAREANKDHVLSFGYVRSKKWFSHNYKQQNNNLNQPIEGGLIPSKKEPRSSNALTDPRNYKTHQ